MTRAASILSLLVPLFACACGTSGSSAEGADHAVVATNDVELPSATPSEEVGAKPLVEETVAAGTPKAKTSCGLRAELSPGAPNMGSQLTLINEGARPVKLVVPGDGSEAGWRTPVLSWVAKKNGKPVKERGGGRCGMMNPIKEDEVFTLAPGERRTISEWVGRPDVDPGTYEVELRYTNDPTLDARKGAAPTNVEALIGATDACEVTTKTTTMSI